MKTHPAIVTLSTVEFTDIGSGLYQVFVDGSLTSEYATKEEALDAATILSTPDNVIKLTHDYEVDVAKITYVSPDLAITNPPQLPPPSTDVPNIYLPDSILWIHWSVPLRAYPDIQLDYKLTGYDWFNRTLEWSLPIAPSGMTINSRGVISWVPSGQNGTHPVTVRMKPGSGASITRSWVIDVDSAKFIFFATNGSDLNTGTLTSPYLTLIKCLEQITTAQPKNVLGRGGTHTQAFWSNASPLINETFTEETQVLIASYPGEQVLFQIPGGSKGPKMNNGEDYVVFDKINCDGCTTNSGGVFFINDFQAVKRCRVTNSNWEDRQNCTGFFIHGGALLDSCTAKDNYDRTPDVTKNSSNFLAFNDKNAGAGSTYLIDCIDEGGPNSQGGMKEKHAGITIQTHLHRCIMLSKRGTYNASEFGSTRHCILFSSQPMESVSGENIDEGEQAWDQGFLYQGNLFIQNSSGTAMKCTKFIWFTPNIDEGLYVKENTYLLDGGADMMLYASQVNNNLGPPDNVGLRNLNIIDNDIYAPDENNVFQYTAGNFLSLTELNALTLPVQSSGNVRLGNVPATFDFEVADGIYRYTSSSQTLAKISGSMAFTEIFKEPIEDSNFSSRGWYDNTTMALSNDGAIPGSTQSIEYKWLLGNTVPENGGAM